MSDRPSDSSASEWAIDPRLLACARCDKAPLSTVPGGYSCTACKIEFPSLDGIPCLFAEPAAALGEWRGRWHFAIRVLEHNHQQIAKALDDPELRDSTRARLSGLRDALADHASRLRELLEPLGIQAATAEYATYLALRTRLPSDQGLMTYYNNIHRDWSWGQVENEAALDVALAAIGDQSPRQTLVLGAGSGRLAYDLHMRTAAELTIALDFNPLLMLIGQRVTDGEELQLYEFPIAARSAEDQAVLRTLAAPEPARDGLRFVVADAHRLPFAGGGFDTVVTPWLIDILPESFDEFSRRVNGLLAKRGQWINLGSLSFHTGNPAQRYNTDECEEILGECGFDVRSFETRTVPYMCSPSSRHARTEEVVAWSAIKRHKSKKAPRYEALPDWLVRGDTPVPLTQAFRTQATTTRVHAFMMSLIDGKRSLKEIARVLVDQKLLSVQEAEPTIRAFLIKMHDEARKMA